MLFVEELYVAPDRRWGVARALLLRLLADGHTSGIRAVELQVDEGHESARAVPQPRIRDELSNGVGRRSSSLTQDA